MKFHPNFGKIRIPLQMRNDNFDLQQHAIEFRSFLQSIATLERIDWVLDLLLLSSCRDHRRDSGGQILSREHMEKTRETMLTTVWKTNMPGRASRPTQSRMRRNSWFWNHYQHDHGQVMEWFLVI